MAIASISAWLNNTNPNFHHGRMLYEQYGDDALVLTIIKSGSGSYHFSKLKEGLEKLNEQSNIQPKKIVLDVPVHQEPVKYETKEKVNLDNAPAEIWEIRNQKNLEFAYARQLHLNIKLMDSVDHRLEAALQLLDHMDYVNKSWLIIDEWNKSGIVTKMEQEAVEQSVADLTTQDLLKELKNLPSSISKARKRYNDHTDPRKKTKALAKVQSLLNRQIEIKRRVDAIV